MSRFSTCVLQRLATRTRAAHLCAWIACALLFTPPTSSKEKTMKSYACIQWFVLISALLLLVALVALVAPVPAAHAASLTVNSLFDNTTNGDGFCALREAITNSNNNDQSGSTDCAAGSPGLDTITFSVTGTLVLSSTLGILPSITETLTINGPGAALLTISGDAFEVDGGTFYLSNITLANGGTGVFNNSGIFTMTNSVVSNKVNPGGTGAIINLFGLASIANTTFYSNTAWSGSGIMNYGNSTVTVASSVFVSNTSVGPGAYGGGIANNGKLDVSNSTFSGNNALQYGGGIYNTNRLTILNTTFISNSTGPVGGGLGSGYGGGIYSSGSFASANITNSTFYGGGAGLPNTIGGGIYNSSSSIITVTNSTFSDNLLSGIHNVSALTVTLRNTIVDSCTGTIYNGGNNIDNGTSCGWGSTNGSTSSTNPLLGPLANNGGATQTMALLPGSPAIDGVTFNAPNGCPSTDQRGWLRPFGSYCDIGAYERGAFLYLPLIRR